VRALLRRLDFQGDHDGVLRVVGIEIDRQAHAVMVDGLPVDLTPTEFNLLVVLASYPGRAYTRLQLLEATQGTAYDGYERTIDTHIKNLRAKLATGPEKPSYIETVFGVGYRFMKGFQQ
jgi:DNA-binding response OmpR family regulator